MKRTIVIYILLLAASIGYSQIRVPEETREDRREKRDVSVDDEDRKFDPSLLFSGGGFGLQLGQSTFLEFSPTLGYKVTERLWPGVGFNYQYWRQTDQFGGTVSQNIIGWRAFSSYQIFESIVGYAEFESLQLNFQGTEIFMNNTWLGLGFRQWIGSGSALDALIVRNMQYEPGNIQGAFYGSPWDIKMRLIIGFN
ncbi:MAG: hypothetical protein JXQ87_16570 [Bacteroidia bacterium]